jgi:uncharacterized protein (UPF0335 family)
MARMKPTHPTNAAMPDRATILRFVERYESVKEAVDEHRTDVAALLEEIDEAGMNRMALKLSVKLRGMDSLDAQAFLRSLDAYAAALGIGDQGDLLAAPATV